MLSATEAILRGKAMVSSFLDEKKNQVELWWDRCIDYNKLKRKKNMAEQSGKLILAPPGSGKSYWIKIHPNTDWKEGDSLYPERFQKKQRNEDDLQELDKLNVSFKKRGYKVITGDWWSLRNFDAIVLPPLDVLEERLRNEERPGHNPRDADATIRKFNEQSGIPIFDSIDDAVAFVDEDATTALAKFFLIQSKGDVQLATQLFVKTIQENSS